MNLEGITLNLLNNELQERLLGGKIAKVFMPAKNSLLLLINKDTTINFLADFTGASPLLYLPVKTPERPNIPPAFCMLLRKHLEEGRITALTQKGLDRVITMDIALIGPAQQIITKHLIFELTGKNSNIIFTDENNIIIDALRHIGKAQSSFRQILPNLPYEAPPAQTGLNFLTASAYSLVQACQKIAGTNVLQNLISTTVGIGKNTAQEIFARAGIKTEVKGLCLEESQRLEKILLALQAEVKACYTAQACVYALINNRNSMKVVVPYKPSCLGQNTSKAFPSLLEALQYGASLVPTQIPEKDFLMKTVTTLQGKAAKKLKLLAKDMSSAQQAEKQKIIADTIMAHLYQLKKGTTLCHLNSIYDNAALEISLSPTLSPAENAQTYYKKYNKFKRAVAEIQEQQKTTKELLAYLDSVSISLDTATTKNEISEIKQELISQELVAEPGKKKKTLNIEKSSPLTLKLDEGTTLYVGKNNKQNDFVTFKLARGHDLWFHAKNIPGSHVILKSIFSQVSEKTILLAAQTAAFFSKGKTADSVPVDYTEKRFVKKPHGAKPGFVIYTEQKTLYVKPQKADKV